MNDGWIAERMGRIEASGIRKAFEMAKPMTDPINLSIGLPDFDVPDPIKDAACRGHPRRPERLHRHHGPPRTARRAPGDRRRPVRSRTTAR